MATMATSTSSASTSTSVVKINQNALPKKIIGIQFSIMSPEEIRRNSVAEIKKRATYEDNKPVIGGLFDPRMGALESGIICITDGLDHTRTPGYFGHIEMPRPIFYMQYLPVIHKILKCICFRCSKLLINKDKYRYLLKLNGSERLKIVSAMCKTVRRCGDDIYDGCSCPQPKKITKEGFATLVAYWDEDETEKAIRLTPELVLKKFQLISDDDITFMGFSPIWSRPEWMICQVLAVPPPEVRPSVKQDSQQRSEDDLTHILVNILKFCDTLEDKIKSNADEKIINDMTMLIQLYVGALVDNDMSGADSIAQRSGRPLKSIQSRLNGKGGRMRGNLMAKRVDFSARSVITADPNLSMRELGVPIKIAKHITKPVTVNSMNKAFLTKLVQNGPDVWPGANSIRTVVGNEYQLRNIDRKSINLELGDVVFRHMMDGDPVLFNRQPTLHRMSMMCHIARIMHIGDTFRMNVADTKPYNADFDGDEMNMHMPQDIEAESELRNLAAVPFQIVSPGNNSTIIGIFQDSMLGSFRFTRPNVSFTQADAMNLLMGFPHVNVAALHKKKGERITNFELLTQIMPPLSLRTKNKMFNGDTEKMDTSNNVIEIKNGVYMRGQMDKGILGGTTKGILHRVCNDFGNYAAADFIDNLQGIVTEYMKRSSFSVGISDLMVSQTASDQIVENITKRKEEVYALINETQIGVFSNTSGKSNLEEFETRVNNILSKAQNETGRIALKNLDADNRFVNMYNAGSKGSEINIQQMIACLGQQNVDGKRIPYGFENRTLPHYTKYDDSPAARGFVESSYIGGLSPQETFFHAMGGRIGLIDTAVKTSTTGYIQRRLIKLLEDASVQYDMTVRNNTGVIIQYAYGDDSVDTVKVENQDIPLVEMSITDIYSHYEYPQDKAVQKALNAIFVKNAMTRQKKQAEAYQAKCKSYIDFMIESRDLIVANVFSYKSGRTVYLPVAFSHIIENVMGQQNINRNSLVDITLLEALEKVEATFVKLEQIYYAAPTPLFKVMYYYYLSPKDLLVNKRFHSSALDILLETIVLAYKRSIVAPGEMVGIIAAQSIGEPTTQMTLNTFHFAGIASKSNVTRGVPRIEEILQLSSNMKNPSLTVYLKPEQQTDKDKAVSIQYMLEHTKLSDIVRKSEICFDPDDMNTLIAADRETMAQFREFEILARECAGLDAEMMGTSASDAARSKWIIRMEMNAEAMLEKNITMDDVNFALNNSYGDEVSCVYSDYNSNKLVFRVRLNNVVSKGSSSKKAKPAPLDQTDQIYMLKNFQETLLNGIVLRGVKNIDKVILRTIKDNVVNEGGMFKKKDIWVLDTVGTNLVDVLGLDYIDTTRTYSNDIVEIANVLGIEAARQSIYNEILDVIEFDGTYLNAHHPSLLSDRMTISGQMVGAVRHGINSDDIGPIAKASFEELPSMVLKAAMHAEVDVMTGISANTMVGQEGSFGTAAFQVMLDMNEVIHMESQNAGVIDNSQNMIEAELYGEFGVSGMGDGAAGACSMSTLQVDNGIANVVAADLGNVDDSYDPFA